MKKMINKIMSITLVIALTITMIGNTGAMSRFSTK